MIKQCLSAALFLSTLVAALRNGEECVSKFGWRGICRPSWDCLVLGELVAQGYQPELCGSGGPVACCPTPNYAQPNPTYVQSTPAYVQSGQIYAQHGPTYSQQAQAYTQQTQAYTQPAQAYAHSSPAYTQPTHNYILPYTQGYSSYPSQLQSSQSHSINPYPATFPVAYPNLPQLASLRSKQKRHPGPFLKTYIQDEDDNTIVRVTPMRSPLKKKKRKNLTTPFKALQKSSNVQTLTGDLLVQDDQISLTFDKPQSSSAKKCHEYAAYAWDSLTELTPSNGVVPISQEFCPGDNRESQVLMAEFPFMAGLGYEDHSGKIFWGCSGTLISKEYVLTAAHCLHPPLGRPKVVRLGTPHLDYRQHGFEVGISEVLLHPLYNPADRTANIALLRLAPVPYLGITLRPACLQTNATGLLLTPYWVKDSTVLLELRSHLDEFNMHTDPDALTLRKTISVEVNKGNCNVTESDESYFCVETVTTDSCQSLSEGGEPLIQKDKYNPCLHTVIGVAIDKACAPLQSTLYTRIDPYISWIENIVWP